MTRGRQQLSTIYGDGEVQERGLKAVARGKLGWVRRSGWGCNTSSEGRVKMGMARWGGRCKGCCKRGKIGWVRRGGWRCNASLEGRVRMGMAGWETEV